MESTHHNGKQTCHKCNRLALTFDESDTPLCGRHATIFVAMSRVETKEDEHWITVNVEASV